MTQVQVRRKQAKTLFPPQHGAWAFLGLPLILGAIVSPATALLVPLSVAWVASYPLSYAALGMARARRPQRFRRLLVIWSAVVVPAVLLLVIARPWLIWVGLGYSLMFAVNLGFARKNNERAVWNDLIFVVECSAVVWLTWAVGPGSATWQVPGLAGVPVRTWVLSVVCALVLTSSTLHVKSLIRERRDPRYARASRVFSVTCLPVSLAMAAWWGVPSGLWLVVPFAVLMVRAFIIGSKELRPGTVGIIELGCFSLVVVSALLASYPN